MFCSERPDYSAGVAELHDDVHALVALPLIVRGQTFHRSEKTRKVHSILFRTVSFVNQGRSKSS